MNRCEYAVELKHKGYNCAQAVLCAFADELNLSEEELKKIGASFGLGMGCMETTCGALVAAGIIPFIYSFVQSSISRSHRRLL